MDLTLFLSSVFTLTLVMDPLGNMPLFVSTLSVVPEERRRAVIMRELFVALAIMMFFLLFGKYIVSALALDLTAMTVAGGIVLFVIALQMIFPGANSHFADNPGGEPFIVPLAIPLVAGPSVLTMVLVFSMQEPGKLVHWAGVIGVSWMINAVILGGLAGRISKLLGQKGLLAMEKLMGMILVTISVQMIMNGLKKFILG